MRVVQQHFLQKPDFGNLLHIKLPMTATVLSVRYEPDSVGRSSMYVLVDTSLPMQGREFEVYATGEEIPPRDIDTVTNLVYLGAFSRPAAGAVFHLFEREIKNDVGDED